MKNKLTARNYSIGDYLIKMNNFEIPRYQRDYSWDKSNILELLRDINYNNYYLGNILINETTEKCNEIIDGQQRMITIFLILLVLQLKYKKNVKKYICNDKNKIKLRINKRADSIEGNLLDSILENSVSTKQSNYAEAKRFNEIIHILEVEQLDPKKILQKILSAQIVEIKFYGREDLAHEMFVNINTKGKPLEVMDVLKSHFFKYLICRGDADEIKEEWYLMSENIGEKNLKKYLCIFSCLYLNKKKKLQPRDALKNMLGIINKNNAQDVFDKFANNKKAECLSDIYASVANYNILRLEKKLNLNANVSLSSLDALWKFFKGNFRQFDILMVAILQMDRKKINNNFDKIKNFITLIFMNHVIQSISGASPSLYKNTFESAACKIYWNYSSLDSIFKEVVSDLKITLKTKKYINNLITSLLCKDKDKDLNYAKIIILLVDKNYFIDLKAEHFIPQSTNMDCCYKIGNIIPVVKDIYGDKSVKEKL